MRDDLKHPHHCGRRESRLRRAGPIAAALIAIGMFLAACSSGSAGPGVAGGGLSGTPSQSPSGDPRAAALAYSRCMRAHGISDFPDPNANGGLDLNAGGGSDLEPNNPQFQAAQKACQSLLPPPPTEAQQKQQRAAALRYAKCMRAHGISDFPDPSANGGIAIKATPGSDLDPNNPQFQAAQKACQSLLPGSGTGGSTTESGGS